MKDKSIVTLNIPVTHISTPHLLVAHLPKKPKALSFSSTITDGHLIWQQAKRKGLLYRSVFILFAALFAFFGFYLSQASLFYLSLVTVKSLLVFICSAFSFWSLGLALKLDPFQEQVSSMKQTIQNRLVKCWKPFERAAYHYNVRGYQRYCYYETEEMIDKAIDKTLRDQLRISKATLTRKQRFLQHAHLLEKLENQLEDFIRQLKDKLDPSIRLPAQSAQ